MDEPSRIIPTIEEQFLREMEELRQDNAFLQNTVTGLQTNLTRMIANYERLTQECEALEQELRRLHGSRHDH